MKVSVSCPIIFNFPYRRQDFSSAIAELELQQENYFQLCLQSTVYTSLIMTAHPCVLPSVSMKHDFHHRHFCAISNLGLIL